MLRRIQKLFGLGGPDDAGARAERQAADWLRRERGFAIVTRNWRNPRDRREEIDLVARDGEALVFVEVKARAAGALVPGYHAVDERKKRALRRAIDAYLAALGDGAPRTFRFDVVEVTLPAAAGVEAGGGGEDEAGVAKSVVTSARVTAGAGETEILHFENVPLFPKHYRR